MESFLYGLNHASHDFREPESLGKNIFTNAFPLALAQYLAVERGLKIPTIKAVFKDNRLDTSQSLVEWSQLIGTTPDRAYFEFEAVYEGYASYTHGTANKSDVVIADRISQQHLRPMEIKLVVVPTSSTATLDRTDQSCEIVVRPPTVEQLAFSIAHSYGQGRQYELQQIIVQALARPNDYKWSDRDYMVTKLPNILQAAEYIARAGLDVQTPLVLNAIWRSQGQKPVLEEHAFDVFVWTDMAFIQLFINQLRRECFRDDGSPVPETQLRMTRPGRSLVWLVHSLFEYSIQDSLDFAAISGSSLGVQTDKAGAFSGKETLKHLGSPHFFKPRVRREELGLVLSPQSASFLLPERRLDAAIAIQHLAQELSDQDRSNS